MKIVMVSLFFVATFIVNHEVFEVFELNHFVSLVFIPSGVRIFSVLVYDVIGALGIFFGSLLISFAYLGLTNVELSICAAFVSAGSAMLSRVLCVRFMDLETNFRAISLAQVVQISLVFSLISATMHQALYKLVGVSDGFLINTFYMFVGDLTGAIIFMASVRYLVALWKRLR